MYEPIQIKIMEGQTKNTSSWHVANASFQTSTSYQIQAFKSLVLNLKDPDLCYSSNTVLYCKQKKNFVSYQPFLIDCSQKLTSMQDVGHKTLHLNVAFNGKFQRNLCMRSHFLVKLEASGFKILLDMFIELFYKNN